MTILAHSLLNMKCCSMEFKEKINNVLEKYDETDKLTELNCFQILIVLIKFDGFSFGNLQKYFGIYERFLEKNEVKFLQAKALFKALKRRQYEILKNVEFSLNKEYIQNNIDKLKLYLNNSTYN